MSLFASVFQRSGVVGRGNLTDYDDFWYGVGGVPASSGKTVNKTSAMRLWAVYACVSLISETLAHLPLKLKRKKKGGGTEDAIDHPLYDILKLSPNSEMTSFTWREAGQGNLLTEGNGYFWIERGRGGTILGLWPVEPKFVDPKRLSKADLARLRLGYRDRIVYDVNLGANAKKRIPAKDMLHVVGFGFNGLKGESVITNYGKETIGNGLALDEFQGKFFKNGLHTGGTLEHPETLGDNKPGFIEALKNRYQGGQNVGVPMVLENGMEFKQHKVSLVDQQFLEQMGATALQVCGIFKTPPSKIGIYGKGTSYNNTEQQGKNFLDTTMLQWLVRWEQAMAVKLLTKEERQSGLFIKFNFDGILRPDAKTRSAMEQSEWQRGVPLNVLRKRNDQNPVEGGDVGFVPMNFIPVDQATEPPIPPPPIDNRNDRSLCGCGHEHRNFIPQSVIEFRAKQERSIRGRDRITKRWLPLIRSAAEKLVSREVKAVAREAKKNNKERGTRDFNKWMDKFYSSLPDIIKRELGPVLSGYMEQMSDEISREIGESISQDELRNHIEGYIAGFAGQWVDSSRGQLVTLLDEIESDDFTPIIARSEDWQEKRAPKVERELGPGAANAIAAFGFASVGLGSIWALRTTENCPFCQGLEGKRVAPGEFFLQGGTEYNPSGAEQPMKIRGNTLHPPIHGGCDCYLLPG